MAISDKINTAMTEIGLNPDSDWDTKIKRCEKAIVNWQESTHKKAEVENIYQKALSESKRRLSIYEKAQDVLQKWNEEWSFELAKTWIDKATPTTVKEILLELDTLSGEIEEASKLRGRIEDMIGDRKIGSVAKI